MPKLDYLLAIDQGTTGTTALVLSVDGRTLGRTNTEFPQHFPQAGVGIPRRSRDLGERRGERARRPEGRRRARRGPRRRSASRTSGRRRSCGTGPPAGPSTWRSCGSAGGRRTCATELKKDARLVARVREKTGLVIDAYFSATKIAWLLDHVEGARARAEKGELCLRHDRLLPRERAHRRRGARDRRDQRVAHAAHEPRPRRSGTRSSARLSACRRASCRQIVGSAEVVGRHDGVGFLPDGLPIAGIAGDQQAALFGQACFARGRREVHVRHGGLRAHEHRRATHPQRAWPRDDGGVARRGQDDLRARGERLHRRCGGAVAPRRPGNHPERRGHRGPRAPGRLERGSRLRPRARRPRARRTGTRMPAGPSRA